MSCWWSGIWNPTHYGWEFYKNVNFNNGGSYILSNRIYALLPMQSLSTALPLAEILLLKLLVLHLLPQITTFQTTKSSKALKMLRKTKVNSVMKISSPPPNSPQKSSPVFPIRPFSTWLVPVKLAKVWTPVRDGGSRLVSDSKEAPEVRLPSPMALPGGDPRQLEPIPVPVGVLLRHQTQQPLLLGVLLDLVKATSLRPMVSQLLVYEQNLN